MWVGPKMPSGPGLMNVPGELLGHHAHDRALVLRGKRSTRELQTGTEKNAMSVTSAANVDVIRRSRPIIPCRFILSKGVAMRNRVVQGLVMAALTLVVGACNTAEQPAEHAGEHVGGRVFFLEPKDGDTIKSMSTFRFGNEGVTVSPVPPGELTADQVRPNMTHYHLGVDTDCLPAGQIIPKADPWIHFGDGKDTIEMQLKPGQHTLVLQSGDDLHRTVAGLCEKITVTVVE
jgi:hypothetical protein